MINLIVYLILLVKDIVILQGPAQLTRLLSIAKIKNIDMDIFREIEGSYRKGTSYRIIVAILAWAALVICVGGLGSIFIRTGLLEFDIVSHIFDCIYKSMPIFLVLGIYLSCMYSHKITAKAYKVAAGQTYTYDMYDSNPFARNRIVCQITEVRENYCKFTVAYSGCIIVYSEKTKDFLAFGWEQLSTARIKAEENIDHSKFKSIYLN